MSTTQTREVSHGLGDIASQFGIQPATGPGVNVGDLERWASVGGGTVLIAYALSRLSLSAIASGILGGALVYRAFSGHCSVYESLGINTAGGGCTAESGCSDGHHQDA